MIYNPEIMYVWSLLQKRPQNHSGKEHRRLWGRSACGAGRPPLAPSPRPFPALPPAAGPSSSAGAGRATCSEAVPCCIRPCSGPSCRAHSRFPSALWKLLLVAGCFLYLRLILRNRVRNLSLLRWLFYTAPVSSSGCFCGCSF